MPEPPSNSLDTVTLYKLANKLCDTFNMDVNPNIITALGVIPSMASLYFLWKQRLVLFFMFFFIRLFIDCLDGTVARRHSRCTEFGAQLDHTTDLVYYTLVIAIICWDSGYLITIFAVVMGITFQEIKPPGLYEFVHDNTILSLPVLVLGMLLLVKK